MGGRGSASTSKKASSTGAKNSANAKSYKGLMPDNRSDIQTSFVDELGFSGVYGTSDIPTATLNSYAIKMKELEREYGAIAASENPIFTAEALRRSSVGAYISHNRDNPAEQSMTINSKLMGNTAATIKSAVSNEKSGWLASTDEKITSSNAYFVTHEYGHMLNNVLAAKSGRSSGVQAASAKSAIVKLAKKYGASATDVISRYGGANSSEFFAEAFASYNLGGTSAYAKAMGEWLSTNKLK